MQRQIATPFNSMSAQSANLRTLRDFSIAAFIGFACIAAQAQPAGDLATTTCGFVKTIVGVLNAVSIVVVTIAVIFSGYQIAFAHKRIGDVAPVFIGALLIGAATQIAKLFLGDSSKVGGGTECSASIAVDPLTQLAGMLQSLAHYA